jgi:hypothetical protein
MARRGPGYHSHSVRRPGRSGGWGLCTSPGGPREVAPHNIFHYCATDRRAGTAASRRRGAAARGAAAPSAAAARATAN